MFERLQAVGPFRVYLDPRTQLVFLYSTFPKSGCHQNFPNVLTRISLPEFRRILHGKAQAHGLKVEDS